MLNNPAARKVAAVIIDPPAKLLVRGLVVGSPGSQRLSLPTVAASL